MVNMIMLILFIHAVALILLYLMLFTVMWCIDSMIILVYFILLMIICNFFFIIITLLLLISGMAMNSEYTQFLQQLLRMFLLICLPCNIIAIFI